MQSCRAQLDTGAMLSLITRKLANSLHARKLKGTAITISSIGGEQYSAAEVEIRLQSLHSSDYIDVRASVVDSIPMCASAAKFQKVGQMNTFKNLRLADPDFMPGAHLDLLLGISHCNLCSLPNALFSSDKTYKAEETIFGWAVGGSSPASAQGGTASTCLKVTVCHEDTNRLLQKYLKLEEVPGEETPLSEEELLAVTHFRETHGRQPDGRYVVGLPKREPHLKLGRSRDNALRRYTSNERSLKRKNQWDSFHQGVGEYLELGHAEKVPSQELSQPAFTSFYLPMHGVVKEESTTTKLRIVFDGSAKTSTGNSLNDTLLPGPCLYPLLHTVINRFRTHRIGMSSDISKMFREVALLSEGYDLHRFLHRDEAGKMVDCRMTRLTFGITTSPYLASQVLRQLASDYKDDFPRAADLIHKAFYMDDCLSGADSLQEAVAIRAELNDLLDKAKMMLRKWRSCSMYLLQSTLGSLREKGDLNINLSPADRGKALGLRWDTSEDCLSISVPPLQADAPASKRVVCSGIARTYDIMGWYAPAILPAKLLLQELWSLQLSWDDPLPDKLQHKWKSWATDLPCLAEHSIPRHMGSPTSKVLHKSLHGFSDASSKAYGGVIYLRIVMEDTTILLYLVTVKSRVAPLKVQTIPRLELCGALLLSNLLFRVSTDLDIPQESVYAWTDSAVVLGWLKSPINKLKVFVAHRVASIIERVPSKHWRHVSTLSNPADLVSRGLSPSELLENRRTPSSPISLP